MSGGPITEPCSCAGGCDCGCCEGVEVLTPRTIANRPGLDALAYRIGTHSSFFETMKARLSSQNLPALSALTTHETGDPSIALLDAWAVVADVLTFYQERIANEGYLRTATERRSALELARLVGYSPRPGVAASTFLAYTLDPGPETVIPAGSRAHSVPGPGELPQPFETSEDLVARTAWNNLQVRLTRPQQTEKLTQKDWIQDPKPVPLYFKGIATQLKPNDPLLIETNPAKPPELYRAMTVTPEAPKDRTRVEVELWLKPVPPPSPGTPAGQDVPQPLVAADAVRNAVERASDLEAHRITSGATVRQVLSHLEPLKAALDADTGEPELRATVEQVLPKLKDAHDTAERIGATRVQPWVAGLTADLEGILEDSSPVQAGASAPGPSPGGPPRTATLPDILEALGKRPTPQPGSSRQLDRNTQQLFSRGSDLAPRLLAVARPELRDVLYKALANVPATEKPTLKVCALRTRAAVFGHNAPPELVRRTSDGVILRTKEWDLLLPAGPPGEAISIALLPFVDGNRHFHVQLTLKIGDLPEVNQALEFVQPNEEKVFDYKSNGKIEEKVHVIARKIPTLVEGGEEDLPFDLEFFFENRDVRVEVAGNPSGPETEHFKVQGSGLSTRSVLVQRLVSIIGVLDPGEFRRIEVVDQIAPTSGEPEKDNVVFLDNSYPQVTPGGWIVLERPNKNLGGTPLVITRALTVKDVSRSAYGFSGKSTRVELGKPWLQLKQQPLDTFAVIRGTAVYAQCEELELAEEPIESDLCGGEIELADLVDGLQAGRWLIFAGERTDVGALDPITRKVIVPVTGVPVAELVMLTGVKQGVAQRTVGGTSAGLPGDRTHTTLTLASPLAYCYRRDTLRIFGNVVHSTHGESRFEVLGSGDGSKALQAFTLKQPPLTYISAPTPSGVESTLKARVDDILWHEAPSLASLGPTDRSYILRTDDGGQTTVVFGNGERGARLPTGRENVRAAYRNGIGKVGNLKAEQISQLATRPLGVKDVINPLPATGGADRDSRDQVKRNAPLTVRALDRLISVQDYEDFSRIFAGVGKASAARLTDGRVQLVHVTIAGEDDIPILETSDLFRNLDAALRRFGDPRQALRLELRQRAFMVVEAEVKLLPDFFWDAVEPKIRAAMLDAFGFARRDLGQDVLLSEVFRTIQGVRGVDYVDVNVLASRDPEVFSAELDLTDQPKKRLPASLARIDTTTEIVPAQLIYLTPEVADTLILKERKS
ncbi:MAG TPA: putative baseplate assembly protein [Thermoanaerobaculia bacterium]|nr:putative baseplate assembly protein [Thermoanaerobaculia bacterium]